MSIKATAVAFALGVSLLAPGVSRADTYLFTSDHCTGSCGTAPYAQAVVTSPSVGTLHFVVSLINATSIVNTGFPISFGFNLATAPQITYANLTSGFTIPDVLAGNKQNPGTTDGTGNDPYHFDGTGYFQYGVLGPGQGGGSGTPGPLSFDITAAGLTLLSIIKNAAGNFFALDILGLNGNTGPVDASVSPVPLPPAVLLFGTALLGLGALSRRRKKTLAAA